MCASRSSSAGPGHKGLNGSDPSSISTLRGLTLSDRSPCIRFLVTAQRPARTVERAAFKTTAAILSGRSFP